MNAALLLLVLTFMAAPATADNAFTRRCEADALAKVGDAVMAQRNCTCMRKFLATSLGQSGHDRVLTALEAAAWTTERARLTTGERETVGSARLACNL